MKERLKEGIEFEKDIFGLIKRAYPPDKIELRPCIGRHEIADIIYERKGIEVGIETKFRSQGVSINVKPDGSINLVSKGGISLSSLENQIPRYAERFPFVYVVSNLPVLPRRVEEFGLNRSRCFVSSISELYIVMNEIIGRIDSGLVPARKKYPLS